MTNTLITTATTTTTTDHYQPLPLPPPQWLLLLLQLHVTDDQVSGSVAALSFWGCIRDWVGVVLHYGSVMGDLFLLLFAIAGLHWKIGPNLSHKTVP